MGIQTDFIGCVDVEPPLSDAEQQYLSAFATSRRFARQGGPYVVPFNPAAERGDSPADIDAFNRVADGQPSLWCHWVPGWEGNCLTYDGHEKFYGATQWLRYLIDHFLAPGAHAISSGLESFDEFTFDHRLSGAVAAYPHDTGELYLIRVRDNIVSQEMVTGTSTPTVDLPLLPYQRLQAASRERRQRPRARSAS